MSRQIGWFYFVLVAVLLLMAACTAGLSQVAMTPPATGVATELPAASETISESATLTVTPSVEATSTTNNNELSGILTGTVFYRQRIALPPGSVIDVQLRDVSLADAPAQVISSQTITTHGENVPIPFTLNYDPAQIDPRFTYGISARITIDGQLHWINTQAYPVLTQGAPLTGVEVLVDPVQ